MPPWLARAQRAALLATAFLFSAGYATIGLVMLLVTVAAEGTITRRVPWQRSPVDALLLSFAAIFLISGVASPHRAIAVGSAGLAALTIYLSFGPLYRALREDRDFLKPCLWAWFIGGTVAAAWAVLLHRLTLRPAFTPALGQNAIGTTMLMAVVLGLGLCLITRSVRQYLAATGCAVAALGLALSYTRGAWIGALAGVLSLALLLKGRILKPALLLLLLVGLGGVFLSPFDRANLLNQAVTTATLSGGQSRIALARAALAIFQDHPVIGTGLNTFSLIYPRYEVPGNPGDAPFRFYETPPFAHNIFLNMAAEGGALGLAAFTAIILWGIGAGWRWYATSRSHVETVMSAIILSGFLGMMVHQLFDGTILSVHLGAGLWFLLAILAAFRPEGVQGHRPLLSSNSEGR